MVDDEIKTLIREFKASVSTDLESQQKRMDDFADEMRQRITTAEVGIINEIRALSNRMDRRMERIESRLHELGT